MSLPAWEIAIIAVISATVLAAAIYVFLRCCKSIISVNQDEAKRKETPRPKTWTGQQPNPKHEVYGVPYNQPQTPTPAPPQQLDPAKLESIVSGGKSELHPYYLEKKEHLGNPLADQSNASIDHKVVWHPDRALIESEFLPATTPRHSYSVHGYLNGASPKPRRVVHINYDTGIDGAPEIKTVTTDAASPIEPEPEIATPDSTPSLDEVFEALENATSDAPGRVLHTVPELPEEPVERRVLHVPRDTWVEFEDDRNELPPAVLPMSSES